MTVPNNDTRKMTKIPSLEDWKNYKDNFDSASAFDRFYGKTREVVIKEFYNGVTEKYSELLYMPEKAFQYYIFALVDFVKEGNFHPIYSTPSTSIGCLFDIVIERAKIDCASVVPVAKELLSQLKIIANYSDRYNSQENFQERFREIELLLI